MLFDEKRIQKVFPVFRLVLVHVEQQSSQHFLFARVTGFARAFRQRCVNCTRTVEATYEPYSMSVPVVEELPFPLQIFCDTYTCTIMNHGTNGLAHWSKRTSRRTSTSSFEIEQERELSRGIVYNDNLISILESYHLNPLVPKKTLNQFLQQIRSPCKKFNQTVGTICPNIPITKIQFLRRGPVIGKVSYLRRILCVTLRSSEDS